MGEPERVKAEMVSANFFSVLGVNPVAGRLLRPEEDRVGAQPVALISGGFWKRKFGSSPEAVGKTLTLDGSGLHRGWRDSRGFSLSKRQFSYQRRLCAHRPMERPDLSRPAHGHGHGRGGPAQAGSDAPASPGRYGQRGAGSCRGISGRRQGQRNRAPSAQTGRGGQHPAISPGAAGRGGICSPDCLRECGELAFGALHRAHARIRYSRGAGRGPGTGDSPASHREPGAFLRRGWFGPAAGRLGNAGGHRADARGPAARAVRAYRFPRFALYPGRVRAGGNLLRTGAGAGNLPRGTCTQR